MEEADLLLADGAGSAGNPEALEDDSAIFICFDSAGICTMFEGPGVAYTPFGPGGAIGLHYEQIYATQPNTLRHVRRAVETGEGFAAQEVYDEYVVRARFQPVHDASGAVVGTLVAAHDVSGWLRAERRRRWAERRAVALADLSTALDEAALDVPTVLDVAVHAARELVGDHAVIRLGGPGEEPRVAAVRPPVDGSLGFLQGELGVLPPQPAIRRLIDDAAAAGGPVTRVVASADALPGTSPNSDLGDFQLLCVPLRARTHLLGTLLLGRSVTRKAYTAEEETLAAEIAHRAALALDNARLLQEVRDRQRALASSREELLRFKALTDGSAEAILLVGPRPEYRVEYLNPAGRRLLGIRPDAEITQVSAYDLMSAASAGVFAEQRDALAENGTWTGELQLRRVDEPDVDIPLAGSAFLVSHPETQAPLGVGAVLQDISARREAELRLRQLDRQRAALLARLVTAQEEERRSIAAGVHDDTIQVLAAVDLRLGLLARRLAGDGQAHLELLGRLQANVSEATSRLRQLLFDLETPALNTGLVQALRNAAAHVLEDTGIGWAIEGELEEEPETPTRVVAYRVAREALVNVRAHSGAAHATVRVGQENGGVLVQVIDDGVGIDPGLETSPAGHLGLATMRERAEIAGGWWQVGPAEGRGTEVRFWLPGRAVPGVSGT
ncbi:ATP-binding protein [Motilibacter aurantiacus]|uniref:ATP-binding protein n=1 Tax=Motilibacter aurantiacus TaxID=2714955 RepID=UPI00140D59B5|nr:ATP-binding protein [Motilibacter aurantiacus]NHC45230.1 GAF domain-containing protein [Motilibacter aurantiacus]